MGRRQGSRGTIASVTTEAKEPSTAVEMAESKRRTVTCRPKEEMGCQVYASGTSCTSYSSGSHVGSRVSSTSSSCCTSFSSGSHVGSGASWSSGTFSVLEAVRVPSILCALHAPETRFSLGSACPRAKWRNPSGRPHVTRAPLVTQPTQQVPSVAPEAMYRVTTVVRVLYIRDMTGFKVVLRVWRVPVVPQQGPVCTQALHGHLKLVGLHRPQPHPSFPPLGAPSGPMWTGGWAHKHRCHSHPAWR